MSYALGHVLRPVAFAGVLGVTAYTIYRAHKAHTINTSHDQAGSVSDLHTALSCAPVTATDSNTNATDTAMLLDKDTMSTAVAMSTISGSVTTHTDTDTVTASNTLSDSASTGQDTRTGTHTESGTDTETVTDSSGSVASQSVSTATTTVSALPPTTHSSHMQQTQLCATELGYEFADGAQQREVASDTDQLQSEQMLTDMQSGSQTIHTQ